MPHRFNRYFSALCILFATPGAIAQDGEAVSPVTVLPDFTVLGEALEDPQREPISTSFLSEEEFERFRILDPHDIAKLAPNLYATDSGSQSFGDVYSMRGLANTVFFGAPAVTIYRDDVPFAETFTYAQQLSAVNSVEILRGPQPTIVGRNAYGGLVNIRSRRPTNAFEGALNGSYGSHETYTADGWLSGPISPDQLHFRFGGRYGRSDGFLKNPITGQYVDHTENWGFDGGLFWTPAPGWDISLTGSWDRYEDGAPRLTALDRRNFYQVMSNVTGSQSRTTDNQALRIAYENAAVKFLSVTSRRNWDLGPYITDLDFSQSQLGSLNLDQDQEVWSQEIRLSSNHDNAIRWNVGAYGSISEINGHGVRDIFTQMPRTDFTVSSFAQPVPFPPFSIPLTARSVSESLTDINIAQVTDHTIEEDTAALFGGLDLDLWEGVTLHVGARVDWVERSLRRDQNTTGKAVTDTVTNTTIDPVPGFPPFPKPPVDRRTTITPVMTPVPRIAMTDEWIHVTPTVGLDFDLSDNVMAYVKTTYAFKPGGFSAYADDTAFVPFGEERVWATEAGLKTEFLDGDLQANVAGFYNSIDDYQVERSFTQTDYTVFNAADVETYGAELDLRYMVNPYLDLFGSIGWTHAEFKDYRDPVSGQRLDGNTPPFIPELDAVIAADLHTENGFFARLEYTVVGKTTYDDFNRPGFEQGSYGILNAAVGWRGENASISVYGTNLTEEEYYTNINPAVSTGAVGAPQQFGVKVGLTF